MSHVRTAVGLSAIGITVSAPVAFADRVYRSEHLPLTPVYHTACTAVTLD